MNISKLIIENESFYPDEIEGEINPSRYIPDEMKIRLFIVKIEERQFYEAELTNYINSTVKAWKKG